MNLFNAMNCHCVWLMQRFRDFSVQLCNYADAVPKIKLLCRQPGGKKPLLAQQVFGRCSHIYEYRASYLHQQIKRHSWSTSLYIIGLLIQPDPVPTYNCALQRLSSIFVLSPVSMFLSLRVVLPMNLCLFSFPLGLPFPHSTVLFHESAQEPSNRVFH